MSFVTTGDVQSPLERVDQLRPRNGSARVEFDCKEGAVCSFRACGRASLRELGGLQIVMKLSGHSHPVRHAAEFWFPKGDALPPNVLTIDDEVCA
jgi:hypothetical protein